MSLEYGYPQGGLIRDLKHITVNALEMTEIHPGDMLTIGSNVLTISTRFSEFHNVDSVDRPLERIVLFPSFNLLSVLNLSPMK